MNLKLPPDIEQVFLAEANAKGLSLDDFLSEVLRSSRLEAFASPVRLSAEEWIREFEDWADSFPDASPIPDEALRRENLYPDRW